MTPPVTITPADLPSLPLGERRSLPGTAAIYVVSAGDAVLYISPSLHLNLHAERTVISLG